jgi:hypothetical protein
MEFLQTQLLKAELMMFAGILFGLYGASWVSYGLRIYKIKGCEMFLNHIETVET